MCYTCKKTFVVMGASKVGYPALGSEEDGSAIEEEEVRSLPSRGD